VDATLIAASPSTKNQEGGPFSPRWHGCTAPAYDVMQIAGTTECYLEARSRPSAP
jgi:hypothetical protein